jgi:PII-like signaling protein
MHPGVPGKRVQIYCNDSDSLHGKSLFQAILETLRAEGAVGAIVTRGIAGYGRHGRIHLGRLAEIPESLPVVITWIDTPERVERLLPTVCGMVAEGLVTVDDVEIVKNGRGDPA